jgi:Zn finger protein HypA/HybF involved in hydrogenase expression
MSNFKRYINVYEFETVLPGNGKTVKFKPITTGQIKKLLMYENAEDQAIIETALDEILEGCVIGEDFKVSDLYLQDRFFLLLEIRKVTKGNTYQFQTICPSCGSQSLQTVNLSEMPVKLLDFGKKKVKGSETPPAQKKKKSQPLQEIKTEEISPEIVEKEISEPDIVEVNDRIKVRMSLVTRGIQKQAMEWVKNTYPEAADAEKAIQTMTAILALSIKGIITPDGEETDLSIEDRVYLLDALTEQEEVKLPKWFEKYDFGVDFSINIECPQCHHKSKRDVPLEDFFF